ncbi:MAG: hypothetical protein ACTHJ0_00355 [Flavipsychrobacter sp.]
MKQLFTFLLLLGSIKAFSQNIYVDMRRNWYAQVPRLELDMLDTIELYPTQPKGDDSKPMFVWQYAGNDVFQILVLHNPTPGLEPVYPQEKWKITDKTINDYYLVVKANDPRKVVNARLRRYKLIPYRDNYLILQKVVLVRQER